MTTPCGIFRKEERQNRMKVQWKRSLCLIFSLVMLLSIAEPIQFAYADDAQEGSVTWEPSDDLGAGEPVSSGILMETDAERPRNGDS